MALMLFFSALDFTKARRTAMIDDHSTATATASASSGAGAGPAGGGGSPAVNRSTAWEGCSVLLDINDGDRLVFARLSPSASIKIGNKKCSLNPLVGCPFGSLFSVEPAGLVRSAPSSHDKCEEGTVNGEVKQGEEIMKDNRALIDNNTAQTLSSADIETMRSEGVSGEEIVKALITNSATFETKTAFSQEKYKLKKQKKYAPKVLLRRPSMRSICETYFKKHPQRTGFMRVDTLSLILCMANVGPHSDALIFDKVGGLVVGSAAERVGCTGFVCSTYFGSGPDSIDIVRMFNFTDDVSARILQAPFSELSHSENNSSIEMEISDPNNASQSDPSNISQPDPSNDDDLECNNNNNNDNNNNNNNDDDNNNNDNNNNCLTGQKPVRAGKQASSEIIKSWKENGFTSLIIAAPEMDVESLAMDLIPLLAFSAPFVIYHQYLQPLATCMRKLQASKMAIGMQISEPWLREYQVLPSRTHPHMQMDAFGGYLLSGTRICNTESSSNNNEIK